MISDSQLLSQFLFNMLGVGVFCMGLYDYVESRFAYSQEISLGIMLLGVLIMLVALLCC